MLALPSDIKLAVIGAGTMGIGIAQVAAEAGHNVIIYDLDAAAIEKSLTALRQRVDGQLERGKRSADSARALLARFTPTTSLHDLADVGLVVEAIVENIQVKQTLFADLEAICADSTIFASNTSSLSITAIAASLRRPERFAGMHFFNPAPVLPLVEIVSGLATDQGVADTLYATAKAWGKSPVYTKSTPGFIVNRVARPFYAEGLRLLEEGAAEAASIDAIMRESGGFRMGPFELMDLIGHDVNYAVTESVFNAFYQDPRFKPSLIQQELLKAGFLGRKSGRGFYHYQLKNEPALATAKPEKAPSSVQLSGSHAVINRLAGLARAAGIHVAQLNDHAEAGKAYLLVDGVYLVLTDGLAATERAAKLGVQQLVTVDLSFNLDQAPRVALAKAEQCSVEALNSVVGFFQLLGKQVSVIADVPGMIVMRTVCMLANEAADAVHQQVANIEDVDVAMCKGVNYPRGPLRWADQLGIAQVYTTLKNLQASYGEDRYRPAFLLRKKYYAKSTFYSV